MKTEQIKNVLLVLLATGLIIGAIVMSNINDTVVKGIDQRQSFNAEQRFLLCSREGITKAERLEEVDLVCEKYTTLEESYATEENR